MPVGSQVLIDSFMILLLDGRHSLEAMRQLYVEDEVGGI